MAPVGITGGVVSTVNPLDRTSNVEPASLRLRKYTV